MLPSQMARSADWREHAFDLTRGIAAYTRSPLVAGLARVIAKHPDADIGNAFNHKQVACKMWARDRLFESLGGSFGASRILGGWYGVLAGDAVRRSPLRDRRDRQHRHRSGGRGGRRDAQPGRAASAFSA